MQKERYEERHLKPNAYDGEVGNGLSDYFIIIRNDFCVWTILWKINTEILGNHLTEGGIV